MFKAFTFWLLIWSMLTAICEQHSACFLLCLSKMFGNVFFFKEKKAHTCNALCILRIANVILCCLSERPRDLRLSWVSSSRRVRCEYFTFALRIIFTYLCICVLLIACHCIHITFYSSHKTNLIRFVSAFGADAKKKKKVEYNKSEPTFALFCPQSHFSLPHLTVGLVCSVLLLLLVMFCHTMRHEYALNYKV